MVAFRQMFYIRLQVCYTKKIIISLIRYLFKYNIMYKFSYEINFIIAY